MSDKEGGLSRSVSRSLSRDGSHTSAKSNTGDSPVRRRSRLSRSRSRSRSRSYRRRSRSRSRSYHRRHHRSRSRSPRRRRSSRYSRSRSASPRKYGDGYSDRRRGYYRSHSRSPMSGRRRHEGTRENPKTSKCVGVFGLSLYTEERDLRDVFGRYGPIEEIQVVYDHQTGRSRGFAFIYYRNLIDAEDAKEQAPDTEIDGRRIRVDYSITQRAHTPTPGIYLGKPTARGGGGGYYSRRSPSPVPYHNQRSRGRRYSRSRSRSYSRDRRY